MYDLILALLGPRFCPWCRNPETPVRDWLANHLPYRAYAGLRIGRWDYNAWIGTTAFPIHRRHRRPKTLGLGKLEGRNDG